MSTLEIRHVAETRFKVVRFHDNKAAPETEVPTPYGYPVGGRPSSHLMQDLRWYLEIFLEYPFDPDTYTAERILTALEKWGREAFAALFDNMIAGSFFTDITKNGYDKLTLHIKSDHPAVLSWPWEALHDGIAGGALGNLCKIERRIDTIPDPIDISAKLPTDKVNILLVTARPFTRDVRYRSISRKLVELIAEKQLPVNVHLLRPPTFARLCEHLTERPHYYHIVHFDGHGAFGVLQSDNSGPWHGDPNKFEANHGHLIFETAEGDPDPVRTEILSPLLREHAIPAVVLNACQSAMVDASAADPFASVAAGLLQSGIRSVVAMAYSLYVSGAEEFLPVFYRHLFRTGDTAEALRKGRQQMFAQPKRISRRGPYPLQDWLVPVAYQQEPFKFSFADRVVTPSDRDEDKPRVKVEIPEKILEERPYGFIGRDSLLLELERAIRRRPGAILIHGVGGVGKTTLVQGFIRWLHDTDGLGQGCIWIRFTEEIRSAEYILNQLGGFLGEQFLSLGTWDKVKELARYMHQTRLFVVWDNFETAAGIPGTSLAACLAPDQLDILKHLMVSIKGGRGKIIVTSRSEETWLGKERVKLSIGGLEGEERWEFLDRVLHDLGIKVDREDKNLSDLVERLGGHPLAMQIVLPMLEDRTPQTLLGMYEAGLAKITTAGVGEIDKFFSTLHMAEQYLDESLRPLLIPLGLHERYFQIPLFEDMCVAAEEPQAAKRIHSFVPALAGMGLLHLKFPEMGVYEMHPAFGSYLRARATAEDPIREKWTRAFVDVMGNLADDIAGKTVQVQRPVFHIHGVNFHHALQEAVHLKMEQKVGALLQFLASYAQNTFNFDRAQTLFEQLVTNRRNLGWLEGEAAAFHHLGMVAEKRRELDSAEQWYRNPSL